METTVVLNGDYGYVILVFISSIFMTWRIGYQVVKAREKFNVPVSKDTIIKLWANRGGKNSKAVSSFLFSINHKI